MKLRFTAMAVLMVCLGATALADLSPEAFEWGLGPYRFLFTKEEAATWNTIRSDADAKAFVSLFWARRDPTPATPVNEFRQDIEGRIKYGDEYFIGEKIRGALTDRGKTLILYGPPKRQQKVNPEGIGYDAGSGRPERGAQEKQASQLDWIYEGEEAKAIFGSTRAEVRFVDRNGTQVFLYERTRTDLTKAQQRAVERAIKQPDLTVAPVFQAAAPAPAVEAPAAPVAVTALTTEALKSAVAELKSATKNPYDGKAHLIWGEYVTSYGETFVPVGLYVPKASGVSGEATFFGVVEDASGKGVLAFEQAATLIASKDDFYIDKSLTLPAGKHRGIFGLAQNGKVVALTSAEMELAGAIDKDVAGVSQLLLSNNVFPLSEPQKANDPYAFGGVRVVPKADRTFRPADELWYFIELRNPGLAEPTLPEGMVPVNTAAVPQVPKVQVKIDVAGKDVTGKTVKMAAPPREIEAIEMKGVPGHYGIGNAIPLSTFKPGEYTFTVKVIDTIKKTSHTLTEKFTVVE